MQRLQTQLLEYVASSKLQNPEYRRRLNDNQMSVALRRALKKYGLNNGRIRKFWLRKAAAFAAVRRKVEVVITLTMTTKLENFAVLLCSYCNTAIGLFKDNTDVLFKAIMYLTKSKEEPYRTKIVRVLSNRDPNIHFQKFKKEKGCIF